MTARTTTLFVAMILLLPPEAIAQPVTQPFTFNIAPHNLPFIYKGDINWADVDGDGDLDAVVTGDSDGLLISDLYLNESEGDQIDFVRVTTGFPGLIHSMSAAGDFDGDGDVDILLAGSTRNEHPYNPVTRLYRNDSGTWVSVEGTGIPGVLAGSADWGDMDGDGDLDLVLTGVRADDSFISVIAFNTGSGTFDVQDDILPAIGYSDVDLGDFNNDGDLDIVLSGASNDGFMTAVYRNDGGGVFSSLSTGSLVPVAFSSVDWGDMDGDGDLDLAVSGGQISPTILDGRTTIYRNNGGSFQALESPLADVLSGDIALGDYDTDGIVDVMMVGAQDVFGRRTGRIYRGTGSIEFAHLTFIPGTMFGSARWGDFDGDGDLDLISTGNTTSDQIITNIYRNERQVVPAAPGPPRIASAQEQDGTITLQWSPPEDLSDHNEFVTYNLRVGTAPGLADVVSPMSDPETGFRWVTGPGNAASATTWRIGSLPNGTYYWSVQAMNNAFSPSAFAEESTFQIKNGLSVARDEDPELPVRFAVHPNYPNPFSGSTNIQFDLPRPANVQIRVYSILGREVGLLRNGLTEAGRHTLSWNGRDSGGSPVGSGVYFYEMRSEGRVYTGKMTLVR